jgi:hypothetical protein
MHVFKHPKYYKELRKRNRAGSIDGAMLPDSQSDQAISKEPATAGNQRSPGPGLKPQASSGKRQAPAGGKPQAASLEKQASSPEEQASSLKP